MAMTNANWQNMSFLFFALCAIRAKNQKHEVGSFEVDASSMLKI
jgi:hypothetical protein